MLALARTTEIDCYTRAANEDCINGGPRTRTKYSYDAAGNTLGFTGETFNFNQLGRMSSVTTAAGTTSYMYNARGELIEKNGVGGTTLFVYDEVGHLLGEYSSTGALIQETVWMDDIPVATLRPNGSTVTIYYVHTDHLNAPRIVTQSSDNSARWVWGGGAPNQNPLGLGTFIYNLRFPGQYSQAETGLAYNYFRDYDAPTGRYLESDPIGLRGGINTYSYVGSNPISRTDPMGLMCTAGLGCYTTPAERAAAQSGNYLGYYQLACAGGDDYACFAQHVAANDTYLGHVATNRLLQALHDKGSGCDNDATLNQIRSDLANDYADYLPSDPANARWPDAQGIVDFHAQEFAKFGLPSSTFGGSPLGSSWGAWGAAIWCPNCGGPLNLNPRTK
jgi:RHS repeat-associated protein